MRKIYFTLIFTLFVGSLSAQVSRNINLSESQIKWTGSNLFKMGEHHGIVLFKSGKLTFVNDSLKGGDLIANMYTINNTDGKYNEMLVEHLKSEDFFNVAKFPDAKFSISKVEYLTDSTYTIDAKLTIKGVTHAIVFEAIRIQGTSSRYKANLIIDRAKWNIRYGSKSFFDDLGDDVISDAIKLEVILTTLE